jgi:hypothetical protein
MEAEVVEMSAAERKMRPLATGVLDYFPDALLAVALCSKVGNDQHNPGQPLHWAKEKSQDEADALLRHMVERGTVDSDGVRHSAKVAWRALAMLQREIEAERVTTAPEIAVYEPPAHAIEPLPPQLESDLEIIRDSNDHAHYVPGRKMGL